MKKLTLLILSLVFFKNYFAYAWDDEAHKMLSNWSISRSILGNTDYYKRLSFDKGIYGEYLTLNGESKNLFGWIIWGSIKEDEMISLLNKRRFDNHFHNPLKESWLDAGLNDYFKSILITGASAIQWAQSQFLQRDYPEGDNSWQTIRGYYYQALMSILLSDRANNFSKVFKGLGHQIHLIEDASIPEHVRNDAHNPSKNKYGQFNLEQWAEGDIIDNKGFMLNYCSSQSIYPQLNLNLQAPDFFDPIAFLIDNNTYLGNFPTKLNNQGLAEYANSNFFSEDTIFAELLPSDDIHYFPFPRIESTNIGKLIANELIPEEIDSEDGKKDTIYYIRKISDGESGENVNGFHLLAVSYFKKFLSSNYRRAFYISELCQRDYASFLVPRAVGYSAALINYFYRGQLEITLPGDGIYSLCTDQNIGFDAISLLIRNNTQNNEEMKNGKVSLIVSYRSGVGNPFVPNPVPPTEERHFISVDKSFQNPNAIPSTTPIKLDFDLSDNPLPVEAVDVTLTVVFKGDLGAELVNAIGVGFKDISESTPVDLFNNTDLVCFNDTYVNYTDPALLQQVDTNHNGIIDCDQAEINIIPTKLTPLYLSFNGIPASATNYYYKFPETDPVVILPNQTRRFYFLSDDNPALTSYSIKVKAENIADSSIPSAGVCPVFFNSDPVSAYSYYNELIWNTDHYTFSPAGIGTLRGNYYYNILIYKNISVPEDSVCTFNSAASTQAAGNPAGNHDQNRGNGPKIVEKEKSKKQKGE